MTSLPDASNLRHRRRKIQDELSGLGDLRPGSLVPRFRRCGKPNCHCAQEGDPGHGPSWSLTWSHEGKTRTVVVPPEAVEETRAQIAEYRRARDLTRDLIEVSTRLCDVHLETIKDAKKKKSSRRSRRTSAARRPPRSSA